MKQQIQNIEFKTLFEIQYKFTEVNRINNQFKNNQ